MCSSPEKIFAGGLLSEKNGNKLVKAGVKLYAVYGGTEFGAHTAILDEDDSNGLDAPVKTSADWAWMQFPDTLKPRWVPQGDDTYELEYLVSARFLWASSVLKLLL